MADVIAAAADHRRGGRHRPLALLLAVVALAALAPAGVAGAATSVRRVEGPDRYGTAASASAAGFPDGADAVVLVRGDDFPDALAAAALAGVEDAPVLLTRPGDLPDATRAEIERLAPDDVLVLGGPSAVGSEVVGELERAGMRVHRIAGSTRYGTAAAVARRIGAARIGRLEGVRTALLTSGGAFADALAAGPLANAGALPLLLTPRERLAPEAAAAIRDLGIERVIILGGDRAVAPAVASALGGVTVERVAGAERTATAAAAARLARARMGFRPDRLVLARGDDHADALAAAPLAGTARAPVLLTRSAQRLGAGTRAALRALGAPDPDVTVMGGTAAVAERVVGALEALLDGRPEGLVAYRADESIVVAGYDGDVLRRRPDSHTFALGGDLVMDQAERWDEEPDPDDPFEGLHLDPVFRDVVTGEERFTVPDAWDAFALADGERVVFTPDRGGHRDPQANSAWLRTADGDTRAVIQFANGPDQPGIQTGHPDVGGIIDLAVDPGGTTLAVVEGVTPDTEAEPFYDVWTVDLASGGIRRLTDDQASRQVDVAPDGDRLLLVREHTVCGESRYHAGHLDLVDLPDGQPQRLLTTTCAGGFLYNPRFLDADTIVAVRVRVAADDTAASALVAIDVSSGAQTVLVEDLPPQALTVSPTLGMVAYATWEHVEAGLEGFHVLDVDRGLVLPFESGHQPRLEGDRHL